MANNAQYSAREAPRFKTTLSVEQKDGSLKRMPIKFENGLFTTSDPAVEKAMDASIANSPNFASIVKKLDRDAALALVEEHKKRQQNAAVRGGVTSDAAKMASRQSQYDQILSVVKDPKKAEEVVNAMRQEGEAVVERVKDAKGTDTPNEGFKENAHGKPADPEAEIPVREGTDQEAASAKELANAPGANPFKKGK